MTEIPKKLDRYYYEWMQVPNEPRDALMHIPSEEEQKARLRGVAARCQRTVLDVGSSVGYLSEYIQHGMYVMLDLDLLRVKLAKQLGVKYRVHGCGEALPFRNKSFDTVVLSEILEHVPFPQFLLKEAIRVGERIVISVPDEFEGIQHDFGTPGAHVRRYTEETLRAEIKSTGLFVLEWEHLKGDKMAWWLVLLIKR